MATSYDTIIDRFIPTVAEYAILDMDDENRKDMLIPYLISASTEFNSVCIYDLTERDDVLQEFTADLCDEEIEILVDLMRVAWLKHKLYNSEKLRNGMSTKDYSVFSPANLLAEIRETYIDAREAANNRLVDYTYMHNRETIARLSKKNGNYIF